LLGQVYRLANTFLVDRTCGHSPTIDSGRRAVTEACLAGLSSGADNRADRAEHECGRCGNAHILW